MIISIYETFLCNYSRRSRPSEVVEALILTTEYVIRYQCDKKIIRAQIVTEPSRTVTNIHETSQKKIISNRGTLLKM